MKSFSFRNLILGLLFLSTANVKLLAEDHASLPVPTTARELFNAGNRQLASTNFSEAERLFRAALATQDEGIQSRAEYNLAYTRFADGAAILKKGPEASGVSRQGQAALAAGENALKNGERALAEAQLEKMVTAYLEGRGAQKNLRSAEKAVKSALLTYGKTLNRWQQSLGDFKSAVELNPADTNANHNANLTKRKIAELVDQIRLMQQMAGQMAGQRQQLGKMLSKLKGQIPAPDAPPGGQGDESEEEDGSGQEDVKPESLIGKEEPEGREGDQIRGQIAPDHAGRALDALPVDGSKRLPMGGDKEGKPASGKNGRNW